MTTQRSFAPASCAESRKPSRTAAAARANAGSSSGSTIATRSVVAGGGSGACCDAVSDGATAEPPAPADVAPCAPVAPGCSPAGCPHAPVGFGGGATRAVDAAGARVAGPTSAQENAPAPRTATSAIRASLVARRRMQGDESMVQKPSARDIDAIVFRAEAGSLYVVATPIGNLRDAGLRALDILRTADIIAAEDTRVTAQLLAHYGIATRARALHEHNELARIPALLGELAAGRSIALVSDAGTPAISDPGARLVRAALDAGHRVVPIPGASAIAAAVSAAGLSAARFA